MGRGVGRGGLGFGMQCLEQDSRGVRGPLHQTRCPPDTHALHAVPRLAFSPKLVMEEAPESYKDVTEVVDTCHAAGISKKAVKLRPIAVVKG
jgi:hypothetical protein